MRTKVWKSVGEAGIGRDSLIEGEVSKAKQGEAEKRGWENLQEFKGGWKRLREAGRGWRMAGRVWKRRGNIEEAVQGWQRLGEAEKRSRRLWKGRRDWKKKGRNWEMLIEAARG